MKQRPTGGKRVVEDQTGKNKSGVVYRVRHHGDSRPVIGADSQAGWAGQSDSGDGCFRVPSSACDSTLEDRARLRPVSSQLDTFPPN